MNTEFKWFNLPNTIKSKLQISEARASEITCINTINFNLKVENVHWFNLPNLIQDLVDQVNSEAEVADTTLSNLKVTWYNLLNSLELLYTSIKTATLCN